jgi:hypothetical protein
MKTTTPKKIRAFPYERLSRALAYFEDIDMNPKSAIKTFMPTKRKLMQKLDYDTYDMEVLEALEMVIEKLKTLHGANG